MAADVRGLLLWGLCFEDCEITGAWRIGGIIEGFDKRAADALANVCENGFPEGQLPTGQSESHTNSGSLTFAYVENHHATFLI